MVTGFIVQVPRYGFYITMCKCKYWNILKLLHLMMPSRVWDTERLLNDDTFYVTASERIDMRKLDQNVPYARSTVTLCPTFVPSCQSAFLFLTSLERNDMPFCFVFLVTACRKCSTRGLALIRNGCGQGLFEFRFQLVYTSLDEVLPRVHQLWDLAQQSTSKEGHQLAKSKLADIIQVCTVALHM
jgi:hypothetical protein